METVKYNFRFLASTASEGKLQINVTSSCLRRAR